MTLQLSIALPILMACVAVCFAQADVAPRRVSFADFDRRAKAGEPISVVFFGGSLTWGANSSDPQRTSYRALMSSYLREKYPRAAFTFHDAAIGGTGSRLGIFRLERDVLARNPDLVFLDFTANDDLFGDDLSQLAAYEGLLRKLIARGILVEQLFFGFKFNFGPDYKPAGPARRRDHLKLAAAYHTAVGDCYPSIQHAIESGKARLEDLWPIDGAHPDDAGYRLFFEAARDGFDAAVRDARECVVPETPIFSDMYRRCERIILVDRALPQGWKRERTYRTSAWFDGLSSRWMGDVAAADASGHESLAPLEIEFTGTLVGVLGEADEEGASFEVYIDGKQQLYRPKKDSRPQPVWPFNTSQFRGRLLLWRELASDLSPGRHVLKIVPLIDSTARKPQLRLESVCVAGD